MNDSGINDIYICIYDLLSESVSDYLVHQLLWYSTLFSLFDADYSNEKYVTSNVSVDIKNWH